MPLVDSILEGAADLHCHFGQKVNPEPAKGFHEFLERLLADGIGERELRRMACTNPCELIER